MRVIVEQMKDDKNLIQLGDIFEGDDNNFYLFVYHADKYILVNMVSATTHWCADKDYEKVRDGILMNMEDGALKHYSREEFHLRLSRKVEEVED